MAASTDEVFAQLATGCLLAGLIYIFLHIIKVQNFFLRFITKTTGAACFLAAAFSLVLMEDENGVKGSARGLALEDLSVSAILNVFTSSSVPMFEAWLLRGLVASAVGDVLLIFKSDLFFLFGLISFLGAHCCYIVAFLYCGIHPSMVGSTVWPVLVAGTLIALWLLPKIYTFHKHMFYPVVVYMFVILTMVMLAACTMTHDLTIAAILFAVSDLGVAREQFLKKHWLNVATLQIYFSAQLIFAYRMSGKSLFE